MALVGCDHLHPQLRQLRIKRVAVVSPVTDDTFRQPHYESRPEGIEHEGCFMLLTTRNPDGDRKTIAVCHFDDLSDPHLTTNTLAARWK